MVSSTKKMDAISIRNFPNGRKNKTAQVLLFLKAHAHHKKRAAPAPGRIHNGRKTKLATEQQSKENKQESTKKTSKIPLRTPRSLKKAPRPGREAPREAQGSPK